MNESLEARWLDDRAALAPGEADALAADPAAADRLAGQLAVEELLSRRLSPDRAHFEAAVALRVRAAGAGDAFVARTLGSLRRRRLARIQAAAAAVLVVGIAGWLALRPPAPAPAAPLPGLRAEYFEGRELLGPAASRVEPRLDFEWPPGVAPAPGLGDAFAARWTGRLRVPATGRHGFLLRYDDGVRVLVDGEVVFQDWTARLYVREHRFALDLDAERLHDVVVEYFDAGDLGVLRLSWTPPGGREEIVPDDAWVNP